MHVHIHPKINRAWARGLELHQNRRARATFIGSCRAWARAQAWPQSKRAEPGQTKLAEARLIYTHTWGSTGCKVMVSLYGDLLRGGWEGSPGFLDFRWWGLESRGLNFRLQKGRRELKNRVYLLKKKNFECLKGLMLCYNVVLGFSGLWVSVVGVLWAFLCFCFFGFVFIIFNNEWINPQLNWCGGPHESTSLMVNLLNLYNVMRKRWDKYWH